MLKIPGGPLGRIKLLGSRIIQRSCQSVKTEESASLNRLEFRNIPVSPEILKYLDIHRLGYISKRKARVNVAKKFDDGVITREDNRARPYPFFRNKGKLINTAHDATQIPPFSESHEIAVIGRSNVGKSSLLNSLLGFNSSFVQKSIVSAKPGETRVLRFYGLGVNKSAKEKNVHALTLVDMPGYGFAYMKEETKNSISNLVYKYLFSSAPKEALSPEYLRNAPEHSSESESTKIIPRPSLKRVLLLIDARHGLKLTDKEFFEQLASACAHAANSVRTNTSWKIQVVMTKCDLVERTDLCRRITLLNTQLKDLVAPFKMHNLLHLPIVPVSLQSHGGGPSGISELCFQLSDLLPKKLRKPARTNNYSPSFETTGSSSSRSIDGYSTSSSRRTTSPSKIKNQSDGGRSQQLSSGVEQQRVRKNYSRGSRSDSLPDRSEPTSSRKGVDQQQKGSRNNGSTTRAHERNQRSKNRVMDSPRRKRREKMAHTVPVGENNGKVQTSNSGKDPRQIGYRNRDRVSTSVIANNTNDSGEVKQRRMNRKQRREARRQREGVAFSAMTDALHA